MKAIVTILDDNGNVVEKDKVILPYKSYTYLEGEGKKQMRVDKHKFQFSFSTMKPTKGRYLYE